MIWFISSLILPPLLARIIGRKPNIIHKRQNPIENGNMFVKDPNVQKENWYMNECPPCEKFHVDYLYRKDTQIEISLN